MNKKLVNETDLHIQFKTETGKHYAYQENYSSYTDKKNYTRDYQLWLEENLINQINKNN